MASRGINKVILVGNLGADPDVRTSPNGTLIVNLRLATGDSYKDQQGQWQDRTEWHRVVIFGRTAEVARDYLRKGSKVYLEGRLQTRKWQDKEGRDQYTTEIVANEMQMLDRAGQEGMGGGAPTMRQGGGGGGGYAAPSQGPGPAPSAPPPANYPPPSAPSPAPGGGNDLDFDDDIPF